MKMVSVYLCIQYVNMCIFLQKGDHFKDMLFFANDEATLAEALRNSSVIDWTSFLCVGNNNNNIHFAYTWCSV